MTALAWDDLPVSLQAMAEQLAKQSATERTAESLRANSGKFDYDWRASKKLMTATSGIPIPPPRKGLHPSGCVAAEAFVDFHFELGKEATEFTENSRADYQVRVVGSLSVKDAFVELEDHWRVDTHLFDDTKGVPHEPHPKFHFQRGGHAQELFSSVDEFVPGRSLPISAAGSWRGLLQSPSPRIPVFPMCPILIIDFTIAQHDGIIWQKLRNMPEYLDLVRAAQDRIWSPLFNAMSTYQGRKGWMGPLLA